MKPCPQMSYELVFQRKQGNILSYHVPKRPTVFKKTYPKKCNFFLLQILNSVINKDLAPELVADQSEIVV